MSKEGIPVCRHYGWDEFSYDEYMTTPIGYGKYTPVDINFLVRQIIEKNDIWFDLDIYADKKNIIEYLLNSVEWTECYGTDSYDEISKVYNFKYMPITLSTMDNSIRTHSIILEFMKNHSNSFVIMSNKWLDDDIVSLYKKNNIGVYCYTVNDWAECNKCKNYGVLGIQTDFLISY